MKLVIVSGLSGSGKTVALHALEDEGFYCMDNLPVFMLIAFAQNLVDNPEETFSKTAIGIDARSEHEGFSAIAELMKKLKNAGIDCQVVTLDAQDDVLIKRFSETRRKHPLTDDSTSLAQAIVHEREILQPLIQLSDLRIDTTTSNVHQLRKTVRSRVAQAGEKKISLQFESFGFKHGVPRDADFVFDVRCLPNPHWQKELRPFTGRDEAVANFLEKQGDSLRMFDDISRFVKDWIPSFQADGRAYLTIAIGCTGGQHRSVYLTEKLANHFVDQGITTIRSHRELGI
ncbi:MAG: RNase adapter RapZ [Gammaproteobacteria bacterium]|jgi:RNase adapter protein RapZ